MIPKTLKIEIWSDIACPFCYIGKHQLEKAIESSGHQDQVKIEWKSFQLDPSLQPEEGQSLYESLAERKGWSMPQTIQISQQVAAMANKEGLQLNFEKVMPANTFNAHRLLQLAKKYGLQNQAKEALMHAYFTEGKNLNAPQILQELGVAVGIPAKEIEQLWADPNFSGTEVMADIQEAQALGVRGVPFFVFDRKYAVSGAQGLAAFEQVLQKTFSAMAESGMEEVAEGGDTCSVEGC